MRNRALAAMLGVFALRRFNAEQAAGLAALATPIAASGADREHATIDSGSSTLGKAPKRHGWRNGNRYSAYDSRVAVPARKLGEIICLGCNRGGGGTLRRTSPKGPNATYAHEAHRR